MLNFTTKAREALDRVIAELRGADGLPGLLRDFEWIDSLLDRGIKFVLPDNGELIPDLQVGECLSLGRLPYPVTIVEFRVEPGAFPVYADAPHVAHARLAIGIDLAHPEGRDEVQRHWPGAVEVWDRAFGLPVDGGYSPAQGMLVLSVDHCPRTSDAFGRVGVEWVPGWGGVFLPYDQTPVPTDRLYQRNDEVILEEAARAPRRFNALLSVWELGSDGVVPSQRVPNPMGMVNEFSVEITALAQLCQRQSGTDPGKLLISNSELTHLDGIRR